MFENDKQYTENQLLILYVLKEIDMDTPGSLLTDILMQPRLINYFTLQSALCDLVDSDMVLTIKDSDGIPLYSCSKKGLDVLNSLSDTIPAAIKDKYKHLVHKEKSKIKQSIETNANYFTGTDGQIYCRCFIRDGSTYIADVRIPVADKAEAESVCENWKNNTSEVFLKLIKAMLPNNH